MGGANPSAYFTIYNFLKKISKNLQKPIDYIHSIWYYIVTEGE